MAEGGPPILPPPTGGDAAAQAALKALELGQAEVQRVSAELRTLSQTLRLEAQVVRVNDNGTITLRTAQGEVDIRLPVQLREGQVVQIRLDAGSPPRVARLSLPPQQPVQTQQPAAQALPETQVSQQAAQRFDRPPVPLGSSIPTQFVPLPIPPTQTGVEVLISTLFNANGLTTPSTQAGLSLQQNPLTSLAQIAQTTLPPPIIEGLQNIQLLKVALAGRQFNPLTLFSNLIGVQSKPQSLPVTGLTLPQVPLSISPLTIIPTALNKTGVINIEKPVNGIRNILSSMIAGAKKTFPTSGLTSQSFSVLTTPQPIATRIFFSQAPGRLLQIPNLPIATSQPNGQPAPLFFGVTLGQTATGDFAILGNNGLAILPKKSVTGPLLPGTAIVAQSSTPVTQPNINLFNIPVVQVDGGLLNFNPLLGDGWPVLEEVLNVIAQVDPVHAANIRTSIPNASNPAQLPSAILFFIAATGIGDVRAWVGDRTFETLIQAGRAELSTLLGSDFTAIASRAAEQTPQGWRPFMVPMFFGEELHRMQFFTRQHFDEGEDGQTSGKQTRFLVNVSQTKLGPIQLDGLVNEHRLDMVLRSDEMLKQEMRQEIRQHYAQALKSGGLAGAINFEHGEGQWVEVDTAPTLDVDQSMFI